jgi:exosortase O
MISSSQTERKTWRFNGVLISQLLLLLVWLGVNWQPGFWLIQELRQASLFNLLLFAGIAGWLAWQAHRHHAQIWHGANANIWAGGLLVVSALAAVVLPWWLDIEQLPVLLLVLGTYGWLGLGLNLQVWRRGLVLAVLVAMLLPFSLQQGTGFGFPVRVLTAHAVELLLQPWQVGAISSQDVIVIENRLALVDLPCSGLKSMWMGSLFLLAATWMQRRRFGWQWLVVATANLGLLVLANIGRVLALVVVTAVLKQPDVAEVLHVPLGLLGFLGVCLASWGLLGWVPAATRLPLTQPELQTNSQSRRSQRWLAGLPLLLAIGLLGLRCLPGPALPPVPSLTNLPWPHAFISQALPLSGIETDFFGRHADTQVSKQAFTYGPLSGSMLLVSSRSWRAQHAPELCFVGNGNTVEHLSQARFPRFSAHWLDLNQGQNSATYWFQASQRTTPDFITRLWSQMRRQEQTWVMVSVLFDQPQQPQVPIIQDFTEMVHQTLQTSLVASSVAKSLN